MFPPPIKHNHNSNSSTEFIFLSLMSKWSFGVDNFYDIIFNKVEVTVKKKFILHAAIYNSKYLQRGFTF
jgi:hypothetical protein